MVSMWISPWHDKFHLRYRHEWKEAQEKKEEHTEQAKGAKEGQYVDHGRRVVAPACWQEVISERSDSNYETLKPHTDIDKNRHDPNKSRILAHLLEPE